MAPRSVEKAAGAAVAAVAGGLILDSQLGIYRDVRGMLSSRKHRLAVEKRIADLGDNVTIYNMLQRCRPESDALWFEGRTWTYAQLKLDADKLATILEQHNVTAGERIAVFTTNSPEMIVAYIALSRIGAVPALINTSLRSQTLAHCVGVAQARMMICTPDLVSAVLDLFNETSTTFPCLSFNLSSFPPLTPPDSPHASQIQQVRYEDLAAVKPSTSPLPKRSITDPGALIYTSGTSGKPKAVHVKNMLMILTSTPSPRDTANPSRYYPLRTYACLPLYHGTCLFTGLYYCTGSGGTFCLARKFSASNFSRDLVESRATRTLYVGELCRYLLRAPKSPNDKAHKVIVAHGNGMAKDVWLKFQARFGIPEIREFYRSTEGIAKFDNITTSAKGSGYVGFQGPLRRYFENDTFLVKYDSETEQPWRDPATGFCKVVGANEPGEAIGRIYSFATYPEYLNNVKATDEKIVRDVFEKGDAFQRMGDLLIQDRYGWVSFLDRTGDTYRWRGENVSAGEVRDHVSKLPEVIDCSIYAVKLQAYDGQAGAAGITLRTKDAAKEEEFVKSLYTRLRKGGMTTWQMPRLVRIMEQIDTGATFKHAKEVLKKRTWDPAANSDGDKLYWLNGEDFVPLEAKDWQYIEAGKARL